jgi:hypothetical protein
MKYYLTILLLILTSTAWAKPYLVLEWNQYARIVLNNESCLVKTLKGNRAVIQRSDGAYIQGCWTLNKDSQTVRIDWNNPTAPGDFSVLRFGDFHVVDDNK